MGTTDQGVGKRGRRLLGLGKDISGSGPGSFYVWVGDVRDDTTYWEGFGRIPPQEGPHADRTVNTEGDLWEMGVSPTVGGY